MLPSSIVVGASGSWTNVISTNCSPRVFSDSAEPLGSSGFKRYLWTSLPHLDSFEGSIRKFMRQIETTGTKVYEVWDDFDDGFDE